MGVLLPAGISPLRFNLEAKEEPTEREDELWLLAGAAMEAEVLSQVRLWKGDMTDRSEMSDTTERLSERSESSLVSEERDAAEVQSLLPALAPATLSDGGRVSLDGEAMREGIERGAGAAGGGAGSFFLTSLLLLLVAQNMDGVAFAAPPFSTLIWLGW